MNDILTKEVVTLSWEWWKKWAMVNVHLTLWMFVTVIPIVFLFELFS